MEWQELVEQTTAAAGMELVQAELRGTGGSRRLRVLVDRPGGIGLDDCERLSHLLSAALDAPGEGGEVIAGSYVLEVSSPGLDRPLVKPADFERFAGQRAQITTRREPSQPSARHHWTGRLLGADAGGVRLELEAGETVELGWSQITQAQLAPEFQRPERPGSRHARPRPETRN